MKTPGTSSNRPIADGAATQEALAHSRHRSVVVTVIVFALCASLPAHANIYEWAYVNPSDPAQGKYESSTLTPGGAGVYAEANANLTGKNLTKGYLIGTNLTGATFSSSNLTNADMTDAIIIDADFSWTTAHGFTKEQLYSTGSYKSGNLSGSTGLGQGLNLTGNNLSGWNFSGINLTNVDFNSATLANAVFTNAVIVKAWFGYSTGLTKEQVYSTASYASGNFSYVGFRSVDLSGANFSGKNFYYTDNIGGNFTATDFSKANVEGSRFNGANLVGANFTGANLYAADFKTSVTDTTEMKNAILTDATINWMHLSGLSSHGFTKEQLYSTASYKAGDLSGINFSGNNMPGWIFSAQNLTSADFSNTNLSNADFTNAKCYGAYNAQSSTWTNAIITGADIPGGFTKDNLYSTASYISGNLSGLGLNGKDLTAWNFNGKNLTGANFSRTALSNATFADANIIGANFQSTTPKFTKEQLYSSASYKSGDLSGLVLGGNDLIGWDFTGMNLTSVDFQSSNCTNSFFVNAVIKNANFGSPTSLTIITKEQLYSTASYKNGDLSGLGMSGTNMTQWNLAGKNMANSNLSRSIMSNANFANSSMASANLTQSYLDMADARGATGMDYGQASANANFIRPDGKVVWFQLGNYKTMRIWDYQAATPLNIGVQQGFSMASTSTLRMVFEDSTWGSLMQMEGMISVTLNGTLELGLADGLHPWDIGGIGTTFRLFDWSGASSVSGQFSQIVLTGDYQGYSWDTSQLYTLGTITLVPEPGTLALVGLATGGLAFGWIRGRRSRKC